MARDDRARRLLGRSRRRLLHLLEPLRRVGLVGVGRALRQEAPLRGAQSSALLRPLRHDALLSRGRTELQGDRGPVDLGALPGPTRTASFDRRGQGVRRSHRLLSHRLDDDPLDDAGPLGPGRSSRTRLSRRRASDATRSAPPLRRPDRDPDSVRGRDRRQAPEAGSAGSAGARALHGRCAAGPALRPPLSHRAFRRATESRSRPAAAALRRGRLAGGHGGLRHLERRHGPRAHGAGLRRRRLRDGAEVRPAPLQDGRGRRQDRGEDGARALRRNVVQGCGQGDPPRPQGASAPAALRALQAQLPVLLALRYATPPVRLQELVRQDDRDPRPVGGQEPDDRLASGGDRQGPLRQLARRRGRLGPLPQALLGHTAADLEVRPLPRRARLFLLYRAFPRGRQEECRRTSTIAPSSIRIAP